MYYNEITEEMWDKIEAKGIVVLGGGKNDLVSFVKNYSKGCDRFPHNGDELGDNLETVVEQEEGWSGAWKIVKRPARVIPYHPVAEWLDKYYLVSGADYTIGRIDASDYGVCLTTDHGDILGSKQVMDFIDDRYELLQKEVKSNKQKELAEKKAKLLEELNAIDKALDGL